ncbi:MAG: hypothetical protein WBM59_08830, partial [Sedimenticolaceae bacterium]
RYHRSITHRQNTGHHEGDVLLGPLWPGIAHAAQHDSCHCLTLVHCFATTGSECASNGEAVH